MKVLVRKGDIALEVAHDFVPDEMMLEGTEEEEGDSEYQVYKVPNDVDVMRIEEHKVVTDYMSMEDPTVPSEAFKQFISESRAADVAAHENSEVLPEGFKERKFGPMTEEEIKAIAIG